MQEDIKDGAKNAFLTQILAYLAVEQGGEIRIPLKKIKPYFSAVVPGGFILLDIDRNSGEMVIRAHSTMGEDAEN